MEDKCGTPCYVAPEVLRGEGYREKCDLFSLGSVYFNLVTRRYLFHGKEAKVLVMKNRTCDLTHIDRYLEELSKDERALVAWLLQAQPSLRPTAR